MFRLRRIMDARHFECTLCIGRIISSHIPLKNCITRTTRLFPLRETAYFFRVLPSLNLSYFTLSSFFYVALRDKYSSEATIFEISPPPPFLLRFARDKYKECVEKIFKRMNNAYARASGTGSVVISAGR